MLTGIVQRLFGATCEDMLSGYRVFSRRYVKSFPAFSRGFETETEMTVHALDLAMPFAEVATEYRVRPTESTSKLRTIPDGLRIARFILRLWKEYEPLRFFGTLALMSGFLAAITALFGPRFLTPTLAGQLADRVVGARNRARDRRRDPRHGQSEPPGDQTDHVPCPTVRSSATALVERACARRGGRRAPGARRRDRMSAPTLDEHGECSEPEEARRAGNGSVQRASRSGDRARRYGIWALLVVLALVPVPPDRGTGVRLVARRRAAGSRRAVHGAVLPRPEDTADYRDGRTADQVRDRGAQRRGRGHGLPVEGRGLGQRARRGSGAGPRPVGRR